MFKTQVNAVGVKAPFFGSCENKDSENEDLRLPPPPTKMKTITKTKTPVRKRRHVSKTSSKQVGITLVDKDYVHETHYENEDPYGNLEF